MANEAAGVYPGLFSLRVNVAKASIALVDALPQEPLHLTLEDLDLTLTLALALTLPLPLPLTPTLPLTRSCCTSPSRT